VEKTNRQFHAASPISTIRVPTARMNLLASSPHRVGVVLVNWNTTDFTVRCIQSLLAGVVPPREIVVVDNASRDDSIQVPLRAYPTVELIRNHTNLGFTGANNIGIKWLLSRDIEYIWILNNDTIVSPACLKELLTGINLCPNMGAVSGKILYEEPSNLIWFGGAVWNCTTFRGRHEGMNEVDRGQCDAAKELQFLDGCCILTRTEVLEEVGLFDDRFFAYHEDIDWSLRARSKGHRLGYVPSAILWHRVSASTELLPRSPWGGHTHPMLTYLTSRNTLYLIRKHCKSSLHAVAPLFFFFCSLIYGTVGLIALGRWDKLISLWRAGKDGLLDKL
jgi:GT2 family glycosyltransferase